MYQRCYWRTIKALLLLHTPEPNIDIGYHFVRKAVEKRLVELKYCSSCKIVTDMIPSKPLSKEQFRSLREAMCIDIMDKSAK